MSDGAEIPRKRRNSLCGEGRKESCRQREQCVRRPWEKAWHMGGHKGRPKASVAEAESTGEQSAKRNRRARQWRARPPRALQAVLGSAPFLKAGCC